MTFKKLPFIAMAILIACITDSVYGQEAFKPVFNKNSKTPVTHNGLTSLKSGNPGMPTTLGSYNDNCDGDNTVAGLELRGYKVYFNGTGPVGTTPTFYQGSGALFPAFNGPANGYIAANFQTVASGDIDNWLVTPVISNVDSGDVFSFYSRSPLGSTYPDSIMVMYSDAGDSIPSATSWVELGNFKVNTSGIWQKMYFTANSAGSGARFAIRYKVTDGGPMGANSDYIGIDQIALNPPSTSPLNNDCPDALIISSAFNQPIGVTTVSGPYDNTTAVSSPSDPTTGFQCFGEPDGSGSSPTIDNSLWFTFIGDGNTYFIETADGPSITNYIDDGNTQIALYRGVCGSLIPEVCNEDGPSSGSGGQPPYPAGITVTTLAGESYYMLIDGFNFNGTLSMGEYNIEVTKTQEVSCGDSTITPGVNSANVTEICENDTVLFSINGIIAPTGSGINGMGWMWSTADISGSPDPTNEPSQVAQGPFSSPASFNSTRFVVNDGSFVGNAIPYGAYYFTPIIFGNAVAINTPANYLWDLQLDPACVYTGNSVLVDIYGPNEPICLTGIAEITEKIGISSVFPVPVTNIVTITVNSLENSTVNILVSDVTGRQVINEKGFIAAGERQFTYNVEQFESGVYFISVSSESSNAVARFIKN